MDKKNRAKHSNPPRVKIKVSMFNLFNETNEIQTRQAMKSLSAPV
jgi:hypothetical protein